MPKGNHPKSQSYALSISNNPHWHIYLQNNGSTIHTMIKKNTYWLYLFKAQMTAKSTQKRGRILKCRGVARLASWPKFIFLLFRLMRRRGLIPWKYRKEPRLLNILPILKGNAEMYIYTRHFDFNKCSGKGRKLTSCHFGKL